MVFSTKQSPDCRTTQASVVLFYAQLTTKIIVIVCARKEEFSYNNTQQKESGMNKKSKKMSEELAIDLKKGGPITNDMVRKFQGLMSSSKDHHSQPQAPHFGNRTLPDGDW